MNLRIGFFLGRLLCASWLVSGCGGSSSGEAGTGAPSCTSDLPDGFSCTKGLTLTQSECQGDADGVTLTPVVSRSDDGKTLSISSAAFRCSQAVCAYLDASQSPEKVLLQPCDMNPKTVARCSCGYTLTVPLDGAATTSDLLVDVRQDSTGGTQPAHEIGGVSLTPPTVLCDGSDSLRFAAQTGGGNLTGLPGLIAETGWSFLLIDGHCKYYAMTSPEREVRVGTLSDADAQTFSGQFFLGHWQPFMTGASGGCADGSGSSFAFGADRVDTAPCSSNSLTAQAAAWLPRLYAAGTASDGPLRYEVFTPDSEAWPVNNPELALDYPLVDPTSSAGSLTDPYSLTVQVATGADAAALRALRSAYLATPNHDPGPSYSIPTKLASKSATKFFDVALRDTVPFETDGKLAVDDFIK